MPESSTYCLSLIRGSLRYEFLRRDLLFGNDDPLFPKTRVAPNESKSFAVAGLCREHWTNATPIRKIFRRSFEAAGLPYFNPHSFRKTLVQLGETSCQTPEQFKAWSQNLGHEGVLTTFYSYGEVQPTRQSEIFVDFRSGSAAAEGFRARQLDLRAVAKELLRMAEGN